MQAIHLVLLLAIVPLAGCAAPAEDGEVESPTASILSHMAEADSLTAAWGDEKTSAIAQDYGQYGSGTEDWQRTISLFENYRDRAAVTYDTLVGFEPTGGEEAAHLLLVHSVVLMEASFELQAKCLRSGEPNHKSCDAVGEVWGMAAVELEAATAAAGAWSGGAG